MQYIPENLARQSVGSARMANQAPLIEGIFPAMLTMFTAQGELDLAAIGS